MTAVLDRITPLVPDFDWAEAEADLAASNTPFYARKAADLIEAQGLGHGSLEDFSGGCDKPLLCLLGALAGAYFGAAERGYEDDDDGFNSLVADTYKGIFGQDPRSHVEAMSGVYGWNDERDRNRTYTRTPAEVVGLLRRLS